MSIEIFNDLQPMIAFRKKHKLKTTHRNKHNKKQPKIFHTYGNNHHRSMYPCYTSRSLCCQQVLKTTTLTSTQTRETLQFFTKSFAIVTM